MSEEKHSLRERLAPMLPKFLMILLILQPLMDILSFWTDRLGMSNTITLLLRFAVFAVVCVLGFVTSSRKKVYGIAIAACAFLLVGHCISCFIVGYQRIVYDLTNFVRVVQMPLFVLCFISFLRANNKCYRAFETGLMLDFWIITASVVVSVLTHTSSATYQSTNVGILGWYSFGNAQSAIMSILAPIVILLCYRRKNFLLFTVTSVAALAQLYLMGTRLAFFSIAVAALGVPVVLVLTGKARTSKRYIAVLVLILAACCATYKQSPMYINQNRYNEAMSYKQNDAERMIKRAEGNKTGTSTVTPEERYHALCTIYNFYFPNMCQRFGTARVMSAYGYSDQVTDITATRHRKIVFCEMLLDEQPFTSRLFGMELGRMAFDGEIYDVENDFHGICFLYGWVGLAMMVAFIGYFLYLIVKCLIKDFRKYFTVEAGAFGIGLCLCLVYAYFTAGVLRRPNASIYMSVLLAVVYYLTQMRSEKPDALPDGTVGAVTRLPDASNTAGSGDTRPEVRALQTKKAVGVNVMPLPSSAVSSIFRSRRASARSRETGASFTSASSVSRSISKAPDCAHMGIGRSSSPCAFCAGHRSSQTDTIRSSSVPPDTPTSDEEGNSFRVSSSKLASSTRYNRSLPDPTGRSSRMRYSPGPFTWVFAV